MSGHCPFHPFMSRSFSRFVRFIVCPLLSLPVISLHLPSCRLVSSSFVSLSFPLHSACFHFFPLAFLSCRLPISSPHVLSIFAKRTSKTHIFADCRQKEAGNTHQQRAGRGIRADPCFATPKTAFSGTSSNSHAVFGVLPPLPPKPKGGRQHTPAKSRQGDSSRPLFCDPKDCVLAERRQIATRYLGYYVVK